METICKLCKDYDRASYLLRSQYTEKIKETFPNVYLRYCDANTLFDNNDFGYCVLERYEQILGHLENHDFTPVIRDIVKEKLSSEYDKLCQMQCQIAEFLSYAEPTKVTVPQMLKDYARIDQLVHLPFQLKDKLNRLQEIHKKHSQLFIAVQQELEESDED